MKAEWHPPAGAAARARRAAVDVYLTLRLSALGFSLMLPLAGALAVAPGWRPAQAAWLVAIGFAFHVFAYVFNDVVDLDIDRSEALRADSPLVQGRLDPRHALALAWAMPPLAFGLAAIAGAPPALFVSLAIALAAMAAYDLWGKRCRWPALTDAVQAFGWMALFGIGVFADPAAPPDAGTAALAVYVFACVLLVNGVHGALRDLANDRAQGARTTAIWLGATPLPDGGARASAELVAYAAVLQGLLVASGWLAAGMLAPAESRAAALAAMAAVLGVATLSLGLAFRRRGERAAQIGAGAWNLVATLLGLPAALAGRLDAASAVWLGAVFTLPLLAMWAYNGSHWQLESALAARRTPPRAAWWRLMRPDKPALAAALTLLGAWLAGAPSLLAWPIVLAAASVALIAAFGFVINDCCDTATDAIGRPERPLPSGALPLRSARRLAAGLAFGGWALAWPLGPAAVLIASGAVAASALYSLRWKDTLLLGNASVAVVVAAVLPYGALAAGAITVPVMIATLLVALYVLAQEALFTLEDEAADRAAGLATTATRLGPQRALRWVRRLFGAFAAAALMPWVLGGAGDRYALAVALLTVAPTLGLIWQLRGPLRMQAVAGAARASRYLWLTSFVPLVLLR